MSPVFKNVKQIKEDALRPGGIQDVQRDTAVAFRNSAAELLRNMDISMEDAEAAGRVEFGVKPHLSEFLKIFEKYVNGLTPIVAGNEEYTISPNLALSLLMRGILLDMEKVKSMNYSIVGRLPWCESIIYMSDKEALEYLYTSGANVLSSVSAHAIPELVLLRGVLLSSIFSTTKTPVDESLITDKKIVDWCLSQTKFIKL